MNLARVSSNGQITVPVEIRRLLKLKEGDKVLFLRRDNGEIVIGNASENAIFKAQDAMRGVSEQMGIVGDEDVQALVDEARYGKD